MHREPTCGTISSGPRAPGAVNAESAKIECGSAHFKALAVGEKAVIYDKFKDAAGLLEWAQSRS